MENTDNNYLVYRHVNLINGKQYIGRTKKTPKERWGKNGGNYKSSPVFYQEICKYGWDNFKHEVLFSGLSKKESSDIEKILIKENNTQNREYGYNIMEGGDAPSIPECVKKKMSESMKGNKNGLGKPCSEEKKKKISEAQKGRKFSLEHREKISMAKKGKTHKPISAESCLKIAAAHKKKSVLCLETNIIYPSIQECARKLNLYATLVCKCCKGKIRSTGGYHFIYYDADNNTKMPNDYPEGEYIQADGKGGLLTHDGEDEDIV